MTSRGSSSPAKLPLLSSAPRLQQAKGRSDSTLVLPQLHEAGGCQGQLLLQPPPGQSKANWRGARLSAPVQDLPLRCPHVRDKVGTGPGPKDSRQDIQSNQEREALEKMKKERLLLNKVQVLVAQEIRDRLQQLHQEQLRVQEAEFKAQKKVLHEKELEMTGLTTLQQRARDLPAKKDVLRAKQHQEPREREKQQSVLEQMACKDHQQVKQIKRQCSYFEQVVRKQQEQALKMRRQREERVTKPVQYGKAVRRLMLERQDQLVHKWAICLEAEKYQQQELQKPTDCNAQLKRTRMEERRATVLPEKYCRAVEHKRWMKPDPKD